MNVRYQPIGRPQSESANDTRVRRMRVLARVRHRQLMAALAGRIEVSAGWARRARRLADHKKVRVG